MLARAARLVALRPRTLLAARALRTAHHDAISAIARPERPPPRRGLWGPRVSGTWRPALCALSAEAAATKPDGGGGGGSGGGGGGGGGGKKGRGASRGGGSSANSSAREEREAFSYAARFLSQRGMRWRVATAMSLLIAAKGMNVAMPVLFKHVVDAFMGVTSSGAAAAAAAAAATTGMGGALTVPVALLLAYSGVRIGGAVFSELRGIVFSTVAQRGIRSSAAQLFRHLFDLDMAFHVSRDVGAIAKAFDRGSQAVSTLLTSLMGAVVPTAVEIVLVLCLLGAHFGPAYMGVTLATMAAYLAATFLITGRRNAVKRVMNGLENQATQRTLDALTNYTTVKFFGNEALELRRYDDLLERYEQQAARFALGLGALNLTQAVIFTGGLTALMVMAANAVARGAMTVGDVVMVNGLMLQLLMPLNNAGTMYRVVRQSAADMGAMMTLFAVRPRVLERPDARPLALRGGAIEFRGVHFAYEDNRLILSDLNLSVPAGRRVALVGDSGSGKSTLLKLLFRMHDVQQGAVLIDGQDVRDVTLQSLRAAIGVVPQDVVLFNDTVHYNIAYGRPDATREEVVAAAKQARVHDAIMELEGGYNAMVGDRGVKLSGGERQRLAIARMLLKNPQIVVWDEATSNLDVRTEKEIMESLREVSRGRTSIFIAHRLSTVVDMDEIIVLRRGRVVERGTHQELVSRRSSAYAQLWALQKSRE
jgi:ABC-type transport system involved in Fe-S cluster assembly fused permease/ATPase subunit